MQIQHFWILSGGYPNLHCQDFEFPNMIKCSSQENCFFFKEQTSVLKNYSRVFHLQQCCHSCCLCMQQIMWSSKICVCPLSTLASPAGLEGDADLQFLLIGGELVKIRSSSWKKNRFFKLQEDCKTFWHESHKTFKRNQTCECRLILLRRASSDFSSQDLDNSLLLRSSHTNTPFQSQV